MAWATSPSEGRRALELQARNVVQRKSVHEPLQTGLKAVDAMTPIGRGQRQLIIGDRQTGKTTVAVDTIINQKEFWETGDPDKQVRCIYVAIGQKGSTIASVRARSRTPARWSTPPSSPPRPPTPRASKYRALHRQRPSASTGCTRASTSLIVFDDLSKQAEAYRAVSLLLRRPPGREAYPGDVFYLHSRLLERCAKLSDALGHGSMTGLPIIETKAGDVSAYIPTNVISITDGQIYLQADLFNSNVRPAIDVGVSVSRVGGAAQIKAMKQVSGRLKLDLAQYPPSRPRHVRPGPRPGLQGPQLPVAPASSSCSAEAVQPLPVEEQVVSIWAGTTGQLDSVPVEDVQRFETEFLDHLRRTKSDLLGAIRETGSSRSRPRRPSRPSSTTSRRASTGQRRPRGG